VFKQSYRNRVKQRVIYFRVGMFAAALGFILFVTTLGASFYGLPVYRIALFLFSIGALCTLLFSRAGWSENPMLDLFLNRISILIAVVGLGIFLLGVNSLGILLTGIGLVLVILGVYFHSPVPLVQMLEVDPNWHQN